MTIVDSRPAELVDIKVDFTKPFENSSSSKFEMKPEADRTLITWSMGGQQNFIEKAMCIVFNGKKMIGDEMEKGLSNLKTVAEKGAPAPACGPCRESMKFDRKDRSAEAVGRPYVSGMEDARISAMPRTAGKARSRTSADDRRWAAVVARDKRADGTFITAVKTTGIYCRPSCTARRPLRENVSFYATCAEAEAAGFRACKRCKPNAPIGDGEHTAKIAQACRLIETAEAAPSLDALAAHAGLSRYHFHRVFKAATGVTPKAYAVAHRRKRVGEALKGDKSVTEAIYEAGFNSSGRFYADAVAVPGHEAGRLPRRRHRCRYPLRDGTVLAGSRPCRGDRQRRVRDLLRR